MLSNKILISIASANEKYLKQTVTSAIDNATNPDSLVFVILDSCLNGFPKTDFTDFKNVFYMNMEFSGQPGIGLARLIATSIIHPDIEYVLQIDAHMIFVKNWDSVLIENFNMLEKITDKPIITSRCPAWGHDENGNVLCPETENSAQRLTFRNFEDTGMMDWGPSIYGINSLDSEYIEHNLICGHFNFSRPSLYSEILHDPRIVWGGDELVHSLRAWCRGYRMFSIKPIICFHYDKKIMGGAFGKDDQDDWRNLKNNDLGLFPFYQKRSREGKKITRDILLGDYIGYWGAPSIEKLREFESACGIDFKKFYKILDQKKSKL